jgi:hypothetical protein
MADSDKWNTKLASTLTRLRNLQQVPISGDGKKFASAMVSG